MILPKATTEQLVAGIMPYGILQSVHLPSNSIKLLTEDGESQTIPIFDVLTGSRLFPYSKDMDTLKELPRLLHSLPTGIVVYKNMLAQVYYLKRSVFGSRVSHARS